MARKAAHWGFSDSTICLICLWLLENHFVVSVFLLIFLTHLLRDPIDKYAVSVTLKLSAEGCTITVDLFLLSYE